MSRKKKPTKKPDKRRNNQTWGRQSAEMLAKVQQSKPIKDVWGDCK